MLQNWSGKCRGWVVPRRGCYGSITTPAFVRYSKNNMEEGRKTGKMLEADPRLRHVGRSGAIREEKGREQAACIRQQSSTTLKARPGRAARIS